MKIHVKKSINTVLFFYLSLIVSVFTVAIYINNPTVFLPFIGNVNLLIVLLVSILIGYFSFVVLKSKTPLAIYKNHRPKTYLMIVGISLLFGVETIIADLWIADYPEDINISFPFS